MVWYNGNRTAYILAYFTIKRRSTLTMDLVVADNSEKCLRCILNVRKPCSRLDDYISERVCHDWGVDEPSCSLVCSSGEISSR